MQSMHFCTLILHLTSLGSAFAGSPRPVSIKERPELSESVRELVDKNIAAWVATYKEIHAAPELSLQETKSAARMSGLFRKAGFEVIEDVGGHGVVGVLLNGAGPTVLIRGDMDALPVVEETGLAYASKVKVPQADGSEVGAMHACGHDVHQTVLAATGQVLASLRDKWSGTLVLVAQPAEEIGRGAGMMVRDGLFKRAPKPDVCIALHVAHDLAAGRVGWTAGWQAANVDSVDIRIFGKGGHGAYPHQTADPIVTAAQVIVSLQTIVSRRVNPIESAAVTVGSIHAGTKHNVIPDEAVLQLTVRSYKDDVRKQVLDSIRQITVDTCKAMGMPREPEVKVREEEFTPACFNDLELARGGAGVFRTLLGADNVVERPPSMGGEDFGQLPKAAGVPGFMFALGSVDPAVIEKAKSGGPPVPAIHSSRYAPLPEPTIATGVRSMSALALSLLGTK